jgi:hypothetical protein
MLEAVQRDDVRVLELGADLCFEHEAPHQAGVLLQPLA